MFGYPKWYEDAAKEIDELFEKGLIDSSEWDQLMEDLDFDLEEYEQSR